MSTGAQYDSTEALSPNCEYSLSVRRMSLMHTCSNYFFPCNQPTPPSRAHPFFARFGLQPGKLHYLHPVQLFATLLLLLSDQGDILDRSLRRCLFRRHLLETSHPIDRVK